MRTWVLVHGAGTGGWLWDGLAAKLTSAGDQVFTPSLRGVGGQRPGTEPDVTLADHIDQIVTLFREHHLEHAVLVGFSYGGFVIGGAADRLGPAVAQLIYLDAFIPVPGRSFFDLLPDAARASMMAAATAIGGGTMVPPAPVEMVGGLGACEPDVREEDVRAELGRRGFHPLATYLERFPEPEGAVASPAVFISCTDKPDGDPLIALARRLRTEDWSVLELPTGHFGMLTMPTALAELMIHIVRAAPS